MKPKYSPIWLALCAIIWVAIIIWGLILSRPRPVKPAPKMNLAQIQQMEFWYAFHRERRGNR